ncbi:MAG: DUF5652 family protein [Candidatus Roizmanbacteria bacterium]|nr:DUF5652 family protein [Candidatus Roizmanbacteria bacterium]
MFNQSGFNMASGTFFGLPSYVFMIITLWELVWKSMALWRAARNNQLYWFIALLLLNTLGILPILYLYVFSKKGKK